MQRTRTQSARDARRAFALRRLGRALGLRLRCGLGAAVAVPRLALARTGLSDAGVVSNEPALRHREVLASRDARRRFREDAVGVARASLPGALANRRKLSLRFDEHRLT